MAKSLSFQDVEYCFYYLLETDLDTTASIVKKIQPENVTALRCDGLVEYCHEYYGNRIYGNDSNWDISLAIQHNMARHSISNITPKVQASYMSKVK